VPELDDIAAADPAFAELLRAERSKAEEGPSPNVDEREPITVTDFFAYMPAHKYIFVPTRELWPDRSVNGRLPPMQAPDGKTISAATWLDKNRPIEQMIWAPGEPLTISGKLLDNGGWIERPEVTVFNLYRPPIIVPGGVPDKAERWVAHIKYVYPDDAEHIINWFAHRVQRPQEKLNHALVLGGKPGIGKDTLIEPVKRAIGPWNFQETQPTQIVGRFNGFLKSVILRISEASDTGGEFDRFQLYEHTKIFIAAPPDVLRIDEKNIREHSIVNVVGIVYTTNHKSDGIYLPADDRRHYVAWSDRSMDDERFQDDYWNQLWKWYDNGGFKDIAAFLRQRDLSQFDPKAPPPKTPAFWAIVDANRAPEEAELTDLIEQLGNPAALPLGRLQNQAEGEFKEWINDRRNRRVIPHRLEKCGYVPVRNPDAKDDGLWRISGKRQAVYAKTSLTLREQIDAARSMRFV
jgi:hypothetical protein